MFSTATGHVAAAPLQISSENRKRSIAPRNASLAPYEGSSADL
jgi:hypothetical protein